MLSSQSEFYLTVNRGTVRSTKNVLKFHPKHGDLISFNEAPQLQMMVFIQLIPVKNLRDHFACFVSLFQLKRPQTNKNKQANKTHTRKKPPTLSLFLLPVLVPEK